MRKTSCPCKIKGGKQKVSWTKTKRPFLFVPIECPRQKCLSLLLYDPHSPDLLLSEPTLPFKPGLPRPPRKISTLGPAHACVSASALLLPRTRTIPSSFFPLPQRRENELVACSCSFNSRYCVDSLCIEVKLQSPRSQFSHVYYISAKQCFRGRCMNYCSCIYFLISDGLYWKPARRN